MKLINVTLLILWITILQIHAQGSLGDKKEIRGIIDSYSASVIARDSVTFYGLFNDGNITWCAALRDKSQESEVNNKGQTLAGSNYFSGSYKRFLRSLYRYSSSEDKFDNIRIIEDGTVATVAMDYSFWADNKMTNWGGKYLTLIKRDGKWKITGVIYSLELTKYLSQPPLKERKKNLATR